MDLLFVVSGKISEIIKANNLDNNIKIKKIDEKDLSKFDFITSIIKEEKVKNLLFSVYSLDYLRFPFFMKYFLFKNNLNGSIIDQFGRRISFNKISFMFRDLPLFLIEILFSTFVLIYYQTLFLFKSEKI